MAKKKYVAIHEVHLTVEPGKAGDKQKGIAPVKPKVKVIPPKTGFMADTEVGDELVAAGAASESNEKAETATDETKAPAKKAPAKKAPAKKAAPKAAKAAASTEATGDAGEGGDGGEGNDGGEGSDDDANDLV